MLTHARDEAMLKQYGLNANDAILAEEKHMGIFEDRQYNRNMRTPGPY